MTAVPRLFETVYHRIMKKGSVGQRLAAARSLRARSRWDIVTPNCRISDSACRKTLALQQRVADRLVFTKWREGVGGRLRYFVSGGAPLSPTLSYAFLAAGIPILTGLWSD